MLKISKYRNKKVATKKGVFDSKLELMHYEQLRLLELAKKIIHLKRQVKIRLAKSEQCKIFYKADFVFYDVEAKEWVIMDSKGVVTDSFRIKKAWLLDNFINFRFETAYKDSKKVEYPFNAQGVDFINFIETFIKTLDKKE